MKIEPYRCRFGTYTLAGPGDAKDVAALLRNAPEQGAMNLLQTREPDFFAGRNPFGAEALVLARSPRGAPMLVFEMREYPVYVGSKPIRAVYLGLLRVALPFRRRMGLLEHAFIAMRGFARTLGLKGHFFSAIATDNLLARRLLEAGLPRMPRYVARGEVRVLLLNAQQEKGKLPLPANYEIHRADRENAQELEALLAANSPAWNYAPALRARDLKALFASGQGLDFADMLVLRHQGQAVGCLGVWDQRGIRQLRVAGYRPGLGLGRPFLNLWAGITGQPRLPAPGESLELAWLPFFCLPRRHDALAKPLLERAMALAAAKGAKLCALGLSEQNRLYSELARTGYSLPIRLYQLVFPGSDRAGTGGLFAPQPEMSFLL